MNKDDVIRMAREAGFEAKRGYGLRDSAPEDVFAASVKITREIERFADLIISHKLDEMASKVEQDFKGAFGQDTCSSWAVWIKEQK